MEIKKFEAQRTMHIPHISIVMEEDDAKILLSELKKIKEVSQIYSEEAGHFISMLESTLTSNTPELDEECAR